MMLNERCSSTGEKKTTTNGEITRNELWIRQSCSRTVKPYHVSHMVLMSQLCFCWIPEVWSRVCPWPVLNQNARHLLPTSRLKRPSYALAACLCFVIAIYVPLAVPFWSVLSPAAHTLSFRWIIRGLVTVLFKGTDWGGMQRNPHAAKKSASV